MYYFRTLILGAYTTMKLLSVYNMLCSSCIDSNNIHNLVYKLVARNASLGLCFSCEGSHVNINK